MATDTTRPANTGGIDISGIAVGDAIFEATGGGYGAPQGGGGDGAFLGAPGKTGDWVTRDGRTPDGTDPSDSFDFGSLVDPHRDIMLTTDDPDSDNPLLGLMKPDEAPHFANGGPEGTAFWHVVAAVVIIGGIAAGAAYLAGAFDTKGKTEPTERKPATSTLPSDDETNNALNNPENKRGSDYLGNPDADQGRPVDDTLVLKDLLGSLLGTTDLDALTSDPDVFRTAMKSVMDGLASGKVGALGELMSRLDGWQDAASDGLTATAVDRIIDQFGATEVLDFIPFREDLEAPDFLLSIEAVRDAFAAANQDQLLTLPHDNWW